MESTGGIESGIRDRAGQNESNVQQRRFVKLQVCEFDYCSSHLRVDKCPFHSVNGLMFPEFDRSILSARPGPGGPPD